MLISDHIGSIAGRLSAEGLNDAFTVEEAEEKLQGCAAPVFCVKVLRTYTAEVREHLKRWRLEKLGEKYAV